MAIFDPINVAAEIVAAFISYNSVPMSEVPNLIESVHAAISQVGGLRQEVAPAVDPYPAVSIRKSVTPDYLICLDDGKRYQSLRRHLAALGMTPEQYRTKWRLPPDYPMIAANYAAKRSEMAKRLGLGRKRETPPAAAPAKPAKRKVIASASPPPAKRKPGRPRKTPA